MGPLKGPRISLEIIGGSTGSTHVATIFPPVEIPLPIGSGERNREMHGLLDPDPEVENLGCVADEFYAPPLTDKECDSYLDSYLDTIPIHTRLPGVWMGRLNEFDPGKDHGYCGPTCELPPLPGEDQVREWNDLCLSRAKESGAV